MSECYCCDGEVLAGKEAWIVQPDKSEILFCDACAANLIHDMEAGKVEGIQTSNVGLGAPF